MAITLRYNPAYDLSMGAAQQTGEGQLLRQLQDQARQDALQQGRLDESARQFDLGLAAQQYDRTAQRGYQYAALGANVAQNQQAMQQQAWNQQNAIEARLAEQQMQGDQMMAGQAAQTQRAFIGEQARMAREAANRRFEKSMKDREVLMDQFQRGMLTPAQEQQAITQWEELSGMDWGMPDEMAAQEGDQVQQERIAQIEQAFFTDPISGEMMAQPGAVQSMLEMGMDMKDITGHGLKLQAEARQRAQLEQKGKQEEIKYQDAVENMRRDDERANQQLQNTQAAHQQKMDQAEMMHQQKLIQTGRTAYQRAHADWSKQKGDPLITSVGPEPQMEDFMPEFWKEQQQQSDGPPDWYLQLPVGAEYTAPDGTKRIKGQ